MQNALIQSEAPLTLTSFMWYQLPARPLSSIFAYGKQLKKLHSGKAWEWG